LEGYRVIVIEITKQVIAAVEPYGLSHKFAVRCKNMWTLGLVMWLFDRDRSVTIENLEKKFASKPDIAQANIAALNSGHSYAETAELPSGVEVYRIQRAQVAPGLYRNATGTESLAYGLIAGGRLAEIPITFASYPITPASSLLHTLAQHKEFDVVTFQAEDEIAAVCAAIGRFLWRHPWDHLEFRTGNFLKGRGNLAGGCNRVTTCDCEYPTGRSLNRHAHKDGAVRSEPSIVWTSC
jgi:2-oxoglutarate ferredoxin oxidoreductase subunit alpha